MPIMSVGSATVNVGDTFTIPVSIADATWDLTAWQFDLSFDPTILQAVSVDEGPFMSLFGATLSSPGVTDNTTGLISLVTDSYVDLPPNPTGSGVLADITFQALAIGVSPLTLANVFVNDLDSGFSITNGEVIVNRGVPAVPEPNSLALLALAFAFGMLQGRPLRRRHRRVQPGSTIV